MAIIIFTVLFILVGTILSSKKGETRNLKRIITSFFNLLKHPSMIIAILYVGTLFYLFLSMGVINGIDLIKDYIKVILFGLIPMIFNVATNYKTVNIIEIIKGLLRFSIIPLFIINEYTFNIFIELFLVLITTIITISLTIAEGKSEYLSIKKVFNFILGFIGITIAVFAFRSFYFNIDDALQMIFWKKMFLELLLICHVPYLIFLRIACYYEFVLVQVKIKSKLFSGISGRLKVLYSIFRHCQFSPTKLDIAITKLSNNWFKSIKEFDDILSSINN